MTLDSDVASGALRVTDALFFERPDASLAQDEAQQLVSRALEGLDDGELFLEYRESEHIALDDGVIRSASYDTSSGFGLRAVLGEETAFAHSDQVSRDALSRAAQNVGIVRQGRRHGQAPGSRRISRKLYTADHPFEGKDFESRAAVLSEIDAYARGLSASVVQVSAGLSTQWQAVQIIRHAATGGRVADVRPLVRLNVSVVVERDGRRESGSCGMGGRYGLERLLTPQCWRGLVDEALRQAMVGLEAIPAPAGEMDVVLCPGWPGILLHEAVGHGLEGDFNRKGTSVFSGRIGQRIAAPGVTVVDDGTLPERRGSLNVDDEGTPTGRTVLIEDGILKAYLQDRLNARLMGGRSTGNGRRESYAHAPMPRMTNTFMTEGSASIEEMIRSTKRGLYAVNFGGGQVDITSGKFVFAASEAYRIEDGKVTQPVHGATLIGSGMEAMQKISMVGVDVSLDPGIGTCGKAGQSVPVGVGQPALKLSGLTIGGTG